jgi:hypothetical protein
MSLKTFYNRFIYSFPIQLVVMHLKKNQIMMLYWLLLFAFITESIAKKFGVPFLFLDPEYMGKVGVTSFFIMGTSLGAFIMSFNISSFILNSFRFPFLATLSRTFLKYAHNNFIIPLAFILVYCYQIINFQYYNQLKPIEEISANLIAFITGIMVVMTLTLRYFMHTNKDIHKLFGVKHADDDETAPIRIYDTNDTSFSRRNNWRVDTYINFPLKVKIVRDTRHYKRYMLERVFRQNHINAAVVEIVVFSTFIILGLFRDYAWFRIPAGASVMLLFTMFIMLSGVFRYWLKAWANTALIMTFILLNLLSKFEVVNPRSQAYGLNYKGTKAIYSKESLINSVNDSIQTADIKHTQAILNKWKAYWTAKGVDKPKMVLLNVSGGGLRSCVFTFRTLQMIDSVYGGELMKHTALICGSSGGMISATYYRELFLDKKTELLKANASGDDHLLRNTGKDLLNSLSVSATVSDLFLNMQGFSDGRYRYIKDRAYAWEEQYNENTGYVLNKRLRDYYEPELNAEIPMMIMSPTIINDGRALHISAQPISYMLQSPGLEHSSLQQAPNGVEFSRFFKDQDASNIRVTSALRMNSAFPYIMPAVSLPSDPAIEVMDAGIRDNYGTMNSVQFMYIFRNWIQENTSGVVMIQIRDTYKQAKVENNSVKTIFEKMLAPMRNVSGNFIIMQDYSFDRYLEYASSFLNTPLEYILFQMPETQEKISLSWHLTEKEKNFLKDAPLNTENREALNKLTTILPVKVYRPEAFLKRY